MHTFVNEIKYRLAGIIICPRRSSQFFPVILNYKVKQDRLNSKTRATYEASRRVFSHAEKMWWWLEGGGGVVWGSSAPLAVAGQI